MLVPRYFSVTHFGEKIIKPKRSNVVLIYYNACVVAGKTNSMKLDSEM